MTALKTSCTVATALCLCLATSAARELDLSKLPPASNRKDVTFAADVRSLFERSCVKCHGPDKPKARLRLDRLEDVLKGSDNGKVIQPGDSAKSLLVQSVARILEEDEWMPPADNKFNIKPLTPQEIGLIRAWIDQGAK